MIYKGVEEAIEKVCLSERRRVLGTETVSDGSAQTAKGASHINSTQVYAPSWQPMPLQGFGF